MSDGTLFRVATREDLPAIVAMLADDPLGAAREDPSLPLKHGYEAAFAAITASPDQEQLVATRDGIVVATLTLLMVPALSSQGARHGQIEAVRVTRACRGSGLGGAFVDWVVERARAAGCKSISLVSDDSRNDAHRFWERLGFRPSHRGFKLQL